MSIQPVDDRTMVAINQALKGLSTRQRVIADNVANIETPGFQAGRVDFESSLRSALASGTDNPVASPIFTTSGDPSREDGNNVNLDDETVSLEKTNLQYQTMVEAMNAKFRLLKTAIGGS